MEDLLAADDPDGLVVNLDRVDDRTNIAFAGVSNAAAIAQVAGDLGITDDVLSVSADGIDDHVGPEPLAILADSPAFAFEPTFAAGERKCALSQSGSAVLIGVEPRKMLPDNLRLGVALEALGARVPGYDTPVPRGSVKIPRVWSLETPPPDDRRQRR